jgi:hypothetical protein
MEDENAEVAQPFLEKTVDVPLAQPNRLSRMILWSIGLAFTTFVLVGLGMTYRAAADHDSGCRAGELRESRVIFSFSARRLI